MLRITVTCLVAVLIAGVVDAEERGASAPESGFCSRPFTTDAAFRSKASQDLYNSMLWLGGAVGAEYGAKAEARWTATNSFDDELRDGFRLGSRSGREDADHASDALLGVSAGLLPLAAIGKTLYERDCHEAYDMATDALESFTLTLFVTEATKAIAGRTRPFVEECDGSPPGDAKCGSPDRKQSFISGHASLAAAGAGLACSYAIKRETWGEGAAAKGVPCALGITTALTTGALRMAADKHWGSDVLVGFVVGATVGYFDTWGPFDWLRFEASSADMAWDVRGIVLPYAVDGHLGARVALSF